MGASRHFDGSDDVIDFGAGAALDTGSALSVLFWSRLDVDSDTGFFVQKINDNFDDGWAIQHSGGSVFVYQNASSTELIGGVLTTNWQRIAVTIGGGANNIYLDGSSVDSHTKDENLDSTANLKVGAKNTGLFTNYTDGKIAYVQVFNRKLTLAETEEALWKPGSVANGLVLYAPLWGTDSTEPDLSGNGASGTVTGAAESTDGPPVLMGGELIRPVRASAAAPPAGGFRSRIAGGFVVAGVLLAFLLGVL